ncbi:MAG: hypothetical protein NZ805_16470 [Armatimonadetes bacterium]|nr:hypothetical protein [Armatimonadota bacterium]
MRPNAVAIAKLCKKVSIPLWCDCDLLSSSSQLYDLRFQSHCGAIATEVLRPRWGRAWTFQSHCGAIATTVL